jgi:hypothetical protein
VRLDRHDGTPRRLPTEPAVTEEGMKMAIADDGVS